MVLPKNLQKKIEDRLKVGQHRKLISAQDYAIDFFSNDYLGLAKIPFRNTHVHTGSTGSRLISGNHSLIQETEEFLANFFNAESALLFPSGYQANVAIYACLPQKDDIILFDEMIHASIHDGMRLSKAEAYRFRHNDLKHLEELLIRHKGKCIYVALESVYSMDGDSPNLNEFKILCETYQAHLILDEAHAAGVLGEKGEGVGVKSNALIRLVSFGKAYGTQGAVLLMSKNVREYIINFSRAFIYSTGISPVVAQIICEKVQMAAQMDVARKHLGVLSKLFHELIPHASYTNSPIKPILIQPIEKLRKLEKALQEEQIGIKAIYPPTVKPGSERLRVVLHAFNTEQEIRTLAAVISKFEG